MEISGGPLRLKVTLLLMTLPHTLETTARRSLTGIGITPDGMVILRLEVLAFSAKNTCGPEAPSMFNPLTIVLHAVVPDRRHCHETDTSVPDAPTLKVAAAVVQTVTELG